MEYLFRGYEDTEKNIYFNSVKYLKHYRAKFCVQYTCFGSWVNLVSKLFFLTQCLGHHKHIFAFMVYFLCKSSKGINPKDFCKLKHKVQPKFNLFSPIIHIGDLHIITCDKYLSQVYIEISVSIVTYPFILQGGIIVTLKFC